MKLLALLPALLTVTAHADDWPDFLGPKRRGVSLETGWNTDWANKEPAMLWKVQAGAGTSSCAVAGGRVFTMGGSPDGTEWILCLEAATGKEVWRQTYDCDFDKRSFDTGGPVTTPVVDGDRVYTLSFRGQLFCWNAADGAKRWELNLETDFKGTMPRWGWAGSPLVLGNMLIVEPGGNGSSRAAVDKLTGKTFWQSGNDPASYASPVIFSGPDMRGAALFNTGGLVCINPRDGTELFRHGWKTSYDVNAATPVHKDGRFFLGAGYDRGVALVDVKSGVIWENEKLKLHFQSPVLFEDHLYFISGDNNQAGKLHCLEWSTGTVKWSQGVSGRRGSVIVAGGHLIALTENGELILAAASAAAFNELGRFQSLPKLAWAVPAFSDRRLFVRNNHGELVCYDLNP